MILVPTLIALAFLWHNGGLVWLCWLLSGFAIFAWLCGKAFLNASHDLEAGRENDPRVLAFWATMANITIWIHWLACLASILASFLVPGGR